LIAGLSRIFNRIQTGGFIGGGKTPQTALPCQCDDMLSEAMVKVTVGSETIHTAAEGNGR